jgi:hypothetical protein
MSFSINIDNVKEIVNNLVKKGVAYIVALYPFLYSFYSKLDPYPAARYDNVIKTLDPAFGTNNANMVYSDIEEVLEKLNMSAKIKIEDKEVSLLEYLQKYILEEHISKIIFEEVENRFKQMSEKDKIALSVACGIIDIVKSKDYPKLTINIKMKDFLEISLPYEENERYFSKVVSSLAGFEISNIRSVFYKYLLGFQTDYPVYENYRFHHTEYVLNVFPFVKPYIERLASEFTKYVKFINKSDVKEKLNELYQKEEFLKLSVIEWSLLKSKDELKLEFLSYFFGIPAEELLEAVTVEGIIYRGFVNPLTYEYIVEIMEDLYDEAIKELIKPFRETFEKAGYVCACGRGSCTFTKPLAKPINIYFAPWPRYITYEKSGYENINAIIIRGIPSSSFLEYLETRVKYAQAIELWLFFDKEKGKLYVASNTYNEDLHKELIATLEKRFTIEFSDQKLEVKGKGIEVVEVTKTQPELSLMQRIKEVSSKDILESVVAVVLKDLGFSVRVDDKVFTKADTQVEVDVLGEKIVGDSKFIVYASCKNWGNVIESGVVREEIGRVEQMRLTPHVRVLVTNLLSENAKKEAIANGFVIIEIGERVTENNAEKAYWKVYEKLNKLFAGVAPKWMQDLAEKVKKAADEIRKIGEELEKAGGTYKF